MKDGLNRRKYRSGLTFAEQQGDSSMLSDRCSWEMGRRRSQVHLRMG